VGQGVSTASWLVPVLAFLGGVLGGSLSFLAARAGNNQREMQGRREEWGRRFTAALTAVGDPDPRRRQLGRALLVQLAKSALASDEERQVADRLLNEDMRYDPNRTGLPAQDDDPELDAITFIEDDEANEHGTGSEGGRP
jgi:hypothetical protein